MPSAYATKLAEGFSSKVMQEVYLGAIFDEICNRDYEGDINDVGSKLNILSFAKLAEKVYNGNNLSVDDLNEINGQLVIDQQKSFYWREKTLAKWQSYIKEPRPVIIKQTASERRKNVDKFILGFFNRVAAGNRVGTDYTTGTVSIDASGNVTGSGTTFTSAMVGKAFTCTGLTKQYRIATFTSTTAIAIQLDVFDDTVTAYDGGVIAGGTSYTIQANTPVPLIDQGYCFNAGEWNFPDLALQGVFYRNFVYERVTGWNTFEPALSLAEQISYSQIAWTADQLPREWWAKSEDDNSLAELLDSLFTRRTLIRDRITAFRESSRNPFPNWN